MSTLTHLADSIQTTLGPAAERLARDYKRLPEILAGLHFLAFAVLLLACFVSLLQVHNAL